MDNQICEDRLITIETKLAYLEDFLNQLQETAVEQEKNIRLLRKENKLLNARLTEIADNMENDIPNRMPPHY
ncbi:MAG: SlyX family protein [Bacteroides sp.]|nr:SlyX family protein [Prevotella sp.]MCM1407602.1 SlyX family protein [Treponema brennaborense]MCM1469248.1 SlyX family protein [Bacteroides sp.]